ncbi:MAG: hypothetical protein ABIH26_12170 [Candidatus Eisenbacteria bacterium]
MRVSASHRRILEERFPHLIERREEGGGRSFRSVSGAEVFRLEADGRRLRLPVPRETLDDLFGGLPFPVESVDRASVIRLHEVEDAELIFSLIEALDEQAGAVSGEEPAASRSARGSKPSGSRHSTRLVRIVLAAIAVLVTLFLAFSWKLAQRNLDQDREQWIETLLRR